MQMFCGLMRTTESSQRKLLGFVQSTKGPSDLYCQTSPPLQASQSFCVWLPGKVGEITRLERVGGVCNEINMLCIWWIDEYKISTVWRMKSLCWIYRQPMDCVAIGVGTIGSTWLASLYGHVGQCLFLTCMAGREFFALDFLSNSSHQDLSVFAVLGHFVIQEKQGGLCESYSYLFIKMADWLRIRRRWVRHCVCYPPLEPLQSTWHLKVHLHRFTDRPVEARRSGDREGVNRVTLEMEKHPVSIFWYKIMNPVTRFWTLSPFQR